MSSSRKAEATERLSSIAIRTFGWPPFLSAATAAAYASCSKWTIKRAAQRGELAIAGRRGRTMMFRREDVDRWMLGPASDGETPPQNVPARTKRAPRPVAGEEGVLARLDKIRRGDAQ